MNSVTLGERIHALRVKNGYSQEMLASLLGVTRQSISHYESNRRLPNLLSLIKIANLFDVPVDTFVNLIPAQKDTSFMVRENNFLIGLSENSLDYTNITTLESRLLSCFRAMDDEGRSKLISIAEEMSGKRD